MTTPTESSKSQAISVTVVWPDVSAAPNISVQGVEKTIPETVPVLKSARDTITEMIRQLESPFDPNKIGPSFGMQGMDINIRKEL